MANLKFMHYKFKAYICSELAGKNCKLSDRVTHAWDSWKKILETITWNLQLTLTLCWLLMPPDVHYFLSCQFFFYARKNSRQKWPWIKESAFDTVETAGVETSCERQTKIHSQTMKHSKARPCFQFFFSWRDFVLSSNHKSPCRKMVWSVPDCSDDQAKK